MGTRICVLIFSLSVFFQHGDEQTATPVTPLPDTQQLPPPLNERNDDLKKRKQASNSIVRFTTCCE